MKFEAKRILVERAAKAQAYRARTVAALVDKKDLQRRRVAEAKNNLRERRAQQARDFFVQRRRLAEVQDKQLQNLRFYGRTTANLKASTGVVHEQLAKTARLHSGDDGRPDDEHEARRNHIVQKHRASFASGRGWMLSSPRLQSLPPLSSQSAR